MTEVLEPNALERWKSNPVSFIEQVLRRPKDGKPFELFPAQLQWFEHCWQLRDDGRLQYPEQCLSWTKKTGKTASAAMEVLTTLLVYGGPYAEGLIVAADLQQAQERVFGEIRKIIESSPLLRREAQITQSRITFPQTGATITAIAAGSGADIAGGHPTIVSIDEIWGFDSERSRRLWDELIPVPTQQISCRLVTTHAGYSGECELLEELYNKGMALPEIAPNLRGGEGMLFTWRHEPLAPWQTEQWLLDMRRTTRPLQYLRQFENRFVSSSADFITSEMWDKCIKLSAPPASNPMMPVFAAIDASTKRDSTAIVAVNGQGDDVRLCFHKIFEPTPGNPIDFAEVEQCLRDLKKRYPLLTIIYDQSQLAFMMQRLASAGFKTEEFVQNPQNLSALTQNLYDLVRYERLSVYPDQKLRNAVVRTVTTENSSGMRIAKDRSNQNDCVIALGMAALRCVQRHQKKVDLVHKYRAFDPSFVDEDLPLPPKPETPKPPVQANSHWWERADWERKQQPQQRSSADQQLLNMYNALDMKLKF
jgi:hypothetical protein